MLAGAGCSLVLAAGSKGPLAEIAAECQALGAKVVQINARPETEEACAGLVTIGGRGLRTARHPRGRVRHEQGRED